MAVRPATQVTLPIKGMTCAACVGHVSHALEEVPGVEDVRVNLATENATLTLDGDVPTFNTLADALEDAGYGVRTQKASLAAALATRLLIGAAAAAILATLMGLEGNVRNTVVLIAAMPAAVFTTILATEYQAAPRFVASVVVISTVASVFTLTVLIDVLRRLT